MRWLWQRATRAAVALLGLGALHGAEPGLEFRSGPARVALVELFTSEGCNSCPPAEAWLSPA
jgi:hypothetical protein